MRTRMFVVIAAIALLAIFTAVNWTTFVTPTTLDLLFTQVWAPLGLVMLGVVVVMALAFVAYMSFWQGSVLMEMRRHNKDLHEQRARADAQETARLRELRTQLAEEINRLESRITLAQDALAVEIRDNGNSLAASLAEMDQRLSASRVAYGAGDLDSGPVPLRATHDGVHAMNDGPAADSRRGGGAGLPPLV